MISGTSFTIEDPEFVVRACRGLRPGIATASEVREMRSQCEENQALCLACPDGMIVVDLRPNGTALEMFMWIGVAFRYGAFQRQGPAFERIARDLGASQIAFQSRRRGWGRALPPEWRRRGLDEYVRSVR